MAEVQTPRFHLSKKFRFEASHVLPDQGGKCARLHGHSWVAIIEVSGEHLKSEGPQAGMLVDFGELKKAMKPLLDNFLDHYHLNDSLDMSNPTSENVARWIYNQLWDALRDHKDFDPKQFDIIQLESVTVEETCTSSCKYGYG